MSSVLISLSLSLSLSPSGELSTSSGEYRHTGRLTLCKYYAENAYFSLYP